METVFSKTRAILKGQVKAPIDLSVIPNYMGINLCSVEGLSWTRQADGQLVSLTIHFEPGAAVEQPKPKVAEHLLNKHVADMEFSNRVKNALRNEHIVTVRELLELTPHELSRIPNMGKFSQQQVIDILAELGMSLSVNGVNVKK